MRLEEFDYNLPEELIAQKPMEKRDNCRLLVLDREKETVEHRYFFDIIDYLKEGDCLVLNDSKVIPARLFGTKLNTGAKVEFLLTKRLDEDRWETLVKPGKKLKLGDEIIFSAEDGKKLRAKIIDFGDGGTRIVKFSYDGIFMERLEEIGTMPLPPYIEREAKLDDRINYQTVYCNLEGSIAAPTAGLHFTKELLEKIEKKRVKLAYITLHVGIGTFRPVKCENIEEHHMHFEEYYISKDAAKVINEAKLEKKRVISVGTTSTRTLESMSYFDDEKKAYQVKSGEGSTDIFIYPGYEFKMIDALITNFHLPKSTLLMLISALYSKKKILEAYEEAVKEKYRFFSYGDAMFIE